MMSNIKKGEQAAPWNVFKKPVGSWEAVIFVQHHYRLARDFKALSNHKVRIQILCCMA